MTLPIKQSSAHYVNALLDDERDKHPFYSDWGIAQHKKRIKELEREEEEIAKANARKSRGKKTNGNVEDNLSGSGGEQMRVVQDNPDGAKTPTDRTKRAPHNREEIQTPEDRRTQRISTVPNVPQVRRRHLGTRKPHKGHKLARSK